MLIYIALKPSRIVLKYSVTNLNVIKSKKLSACAFL